MDFEQGLDRFKQYARGKDWYDDFTLYEARLRENLHAESLFGTNEQLRSDRARIISQLNQLALEKLGMDFNDLCLNTVRPSGFPTSAQPPQEEQQKGLILFYSYAPEDEALRKKLEKHLVMLKRQKLITQVHAHMVGPGFPQAEVSGLLEQAQIILLLLSQDFLSSDEHYENQLTPALKMQQEHRARTVPILLHDCSWKDTPLSGLVVLPRNNKPIGEWSNQDRAFVEVAEEIKLIVNKIREANTTS